MSRPKVAAHQDDRKRLRDSQAAVCVVGFKLGVRSSGLGFEQDWQVLHISR